ncbi:riboflavin synthase [Falsibacillus pallidus]|uniref:Riboflavin synthase n=1 Tax=Falsibacillus pallidus TaxID=493781 RepID=A0A370GIT1_9BACI|nr:riboflavin synthase [Falsibacillus pallidus]RDI43126.1 riboflavin synthase alpha chain [Falsibacillus pallidus]
MFTGIIEEIGKIKQIERKAYSMKLVIEARKVLQDARLGDSISVNGVCLTITSFKDSEFEADVMPETFIHTSLKDLQPQSNVNLERALSANGRLGGHFVSGHVDCTGKIIKTDMVENALYMTIELDGKCMKYVMEKGSVAVDGTSLTVFKVSSNSITISLIPHTRHQTIISNKKVGQAVNIECDMLAKYLERLVTAKESPSPSSGITLDYLSEKGFL